MGGDLATLLKEEPVLSEDSVRGFGQDLALALQHVHANGLVMLSPQLPRMKSPVSGVRNSSALPSNARSCKLVTPDSLVPDLRSTTT